MQKRIYSDSKGKAVKLMEATYLVFGMYWAAVAHYIAVWFCYSKVNGADAGASFGGGGASQTVKLLELQRW